MSVWDGLIGQADAVAELSTAAIEPAAMTHAWLITGPPGSGRSNAARAFAAALQCRAGGCGTCPDCTTTLAGTHADVTLVTTDHVQFTVDEVRSLIGLAQRAPAGGRWRVLVLEDADRMTEKTSNVLLKAIEEPPGRTVWLLCAPSPHDVVVTIRSRCRGVGLRVPPVADVAALLVARDGVTPEVAEAAARAAQSHIGVARRLARDPEARARRTRTLELAAGIRGVGDAVLVAAELVEVSAAESKAVTADRDADERAALMRSLGAGDGGRLPPALRAQVRRLEEDQKRRATRAQRDVLDRTLLDLASLYRDVLVRQLGAPVPAINTALAEQVEALAAASTPEQTLRRLDAVAEARTRLAGNVAPLLAIEAMAVALRPQG